MATRDDDKDLLEEGLALLGDGEDELSEREQALFEQIAERIEEPGLQDRILERYMNFGKDLIGDALPSRIDPRIAKSLEPILGDVSNVRVHKGAMAASAARAMDARAFAVGDQDIFLDPAHLSSSPQEAGALIAHEVAHTRDASTGFALSSKLGGDSSAREEFAHEVANRFAMEFDDDGETMAREHDEKAPVVKHDGMPGEPEVDQELLADKIVRIMEEQDIRFNDRVGRWSN
ncbi:MAG: DUF4157 domain-containing protein [Myxococcales bacterium]|nr:DUF4157 domain-containing protein [Myxococcales bacterium]MCB9734001.1 DUF4157 domain-containing protein [Deltaproteobacteria bacterium]